MSFLGDIFGGRSKQTSTAVTQMDAPAYLRPYLESGVSRAEDIYQSPLTYFPNQTYVDFAPSTQAALDRGKARAMAGSPLLTGAQNFVNTAMGGGFQNPATSMLLDTAQGNFLNPNPYLNAAHQPAIDKIQGQFSRAGRLGSGANMSAMTSALAPVYAANYADERNKQIAAQTALGTLGQQDFLNRFNAAQAAPGLAAQDYGDIGKLAAFGMAREQKTAEQLKEDIARFNFMQSEPQARLSDYLANIKGGTIQGTGPRPQPIYEKPTASAIGNIANLAGAAYYGSKAMGWS